jgi:hypothetical protein
MKSDIERICPTPPANKPWLSENTVLVKALRILAEDIQSDDGVANVCIYEAAERIQQLSDQLTKWKQCAHDLAVYGMSNSWQSLDWQEAMTRYVKLREGEQ